MVATPNSVFTNFIFLVRRLVAISVATISKLFRIPYSDKVRLYYILRSSWTNTHKNFHSFVVSLCDFSSLMVNEDENVPNWTLDDIGVLSQKTAKKFYLLVWNV